MLKKLLPQWGGINHFNSKEQCEINTCILLDLVSYMHIIVCIERALPHWGRAYKIIKRPTGAKQTKLGD